MNDAENEVFSENNERKIRKKNLHLFLGITVIIIELRIYAKRVLNLMLNS